MIQRSARLKRKKLPFFIPLVIALIIVVGAVYLLRMFLQPGSVSEVAAMPIARFTLASGTARVLFPNDPGYSIDASYGNVNLNVGEGVETMGSTRLEMVLQDGSVVRLDGNSSLHIREFKSQNNKKTIALTLNKGNAWVKLADPAAIDSFEISARLSRMQIQAGTFAVTRNSIEDIYRGIVGSGTVFILDPDQKVLNNVSLSLGQQVRVTDQVVADLMAKKSVQLLELLDDSFRNSDWYNYNIARDNNTLLPDNANVFVPNANTSPSTGSGAVIEGPAGVPTVRVTSPSDGTTITSNSVTLQGTVSPTASKVVVDDYTLQKYVAGNTSWQYVASVANGNLLVGKNVFQIYAQNSSGQRGQVVSFTLYYQPNANSSSSAGGTLSAPVILQPNGGKDYTTTQSRITISGTVGASAQKVFVNGYALQKYVPGSGTWQYNAYEEYGTLQSGKNTYTVYAVDAGGKRSTSATMNITYNKPAGSGTGTTVP